MKTLFATWTVSLLIEGHFWNTSDIHCSAVNEKCNHCWTKQFFSVCLFLCLFFALSWVNVRSIFFWKTPEWLNLLYLYIGRMSEWNFRVLKPRTCALNFKRWRQVRFIENFIKRHQCALFWNTCKYMYMYKYNIHVGFSDTEPIKKLPCKMKVECQRHPGVSTTESQLLDSDHSHVWQIQWSIYLRVLCLRLLIFLKDAQILSQMHPIGGKKITLSLLRSWLDDFSSLFTKNFKIRIKVSNVWS